MKNWTVSKLNKENAISIRQNYGVAPIVATLLDIRGINTDEEINSFLSDDNDMCDPFLMTDMDKAANRINQALNAGESICIYGDYDADGVTSTALLYSYLTDKGANVMYYIPSRDSEGYGLNIAAINKIDNNNIKLIITVDNGISAYNEIEYANELGMQVVVTDHHRPPEKLPNAVAVVDPHRLDFEYPFKELSGVGVVFKLIMALEDDDLDVDTLLDKYSDIAALGTIGDIVSLTGENRIIVKNGIKSITNMNRLGIKELLKDAGLAGNSLSAGRISFTLVPRINACGRLALSEKSVRLLITDDKSEANEIALQLGADNKQRQQIEHDILEKIKVYIEENPLVKSRRIMVISGEGWHAGVIGIVASRLKEIYGKPVIIITFDENGAKGSGRSIKGFSLIDAITSCKDLLEHFGGHPMAAGLSMMTDKIDEFDRQINEYAMSLGEMPLPQLEIDCKLNPQALTVNTVKQLQILEPYGAGNPTPLFGLYNMTLTAINTLGGGKHLKLTFARKDTTVTGLLFGVTPNMFPYVVGDILDLAVTVDINLYNGSETLSVVVRDLKFANDEMDKHIISNRIYESVIRGESITDDDKKSIIPIREEFAKVFVYLRKCGGWHFAPYILLHRITADNNISYGKLMVILTAMKQLSLIEYYENSGVLFIKMLQPKEKVNLDSAPIIKMLLQ